MTTRTPFPFLVVAIALSLVAAITSVAAFGALGRGSAPRVPLVETALALESSVVAVAATTPLTPESTASATPSATVKPPAPIATPPGTTSTQPAPSAPDTSNSDDDEEDDDREVITPEIRDDDHSEDKESRPAEDEADTRDTEEH